MPKIANLITTSTMETSQKIGEQEQTPTSSKNASALNSAKTKKLKPSAPALNDPYFMNATTSEKEIIKELVKADVEAMLERDAVALLPSLNDELGDFAVEAITKPSKVVTAATKIKKEPATHWSYRANDTKFGQSPAAKMSGPPQKPGAIKTKTAKLKGKPNVVTPVPLAISKSKRR